MAAIPHVQREQNERAVRMLSRLLQHLHAACDRLTESRAQMGALDEERKQDRQLHPEYAEVSHRDRMAHWTVLIGAPAVLFLDVLLLNSTAEYIASGFFPGQPKMVLFARLAVPVFLFCLECLIAQHVYKALREEEGVSTKAILWASLGVGLAACAAAAVAFSMAALEAADGGDAGTLGPLGWALCLLAFLIHSSIVFAGGELYNAKGYWCFQYHHNSLRRQWRRFEMMHIRARREVNETFLAYFRQLNLPSTTLDGTAKAGPFSKVVHDTVNEVFGPGTIPDSSPAGSQPPEDGSSAATVTVVSPQSPSTDPSAAQPPADSEHAQDQNVSGAGAQDGEQVVDNDYMRQILERARLEQDEEVRA
jgi:hypothetical protein